MSTRRPSWRNTSRRIKNRARNRKKKIIGQVVSYCWACGAHRQTCHDEARLSVRDFRKGHNVQVKRKFSLVEPYTWCMYVCRFLELEIAIIMERTAKNWPHCPAKSHYNLVFFRGLEWNTGPCCYWCIASGSWRSTWPWALPLMPEASMPHDEAKQHRREVAVKIADSLPSCKSW